MANTLLLLLGRKNYQKTPNKRLLKLEIIDYRMGYLAEIDTQSIDWHQIN
jgi:hypothetical protein